MTLMDAQQYDEARGRRRRNLIIAGVFAFLILAWVAYHFRNYPQRHTVDKFFGALQRQDMETAYGIWLHDPNWKQHAQTYAQKYSFGEFQQDWGPSGEWGIIKSHTVDCSLSSGNGVIVQVTVNGRTQHAYVWVSKDDRTLSFPPADIDCGNWWGWVTE